MALVAVLLFRWDACHEGLLAIICSFRPNFCCEVGCEKRKFMRPHALYLEGRSPLYWVCAYANNQHKISEEISEDLSQTSFYKAMRLSKGTVSVIDDNGECFGRIWCIFELYHSLVDIKRRYTYDMYTYFEHSWVGKRQGQGSHESRKAVGITEGLSASDHTAQDKHNRERHFPRSLIQQGLNVDCRTSKATMLGDKDRILKQIGDKAETLNWTVHGVVAGSCTRKYVEQDDQQWGLHLEYIARGKLGKFQVDLSACTITEERINQLLQALDTASLKHLRLSGVSIGCSMWGAHLPTFSSLTTLILNDNPGLWKLPEEIGALTELKILSIENCDTLVELPSSLCSLSHLESFNAGLCDALRSLPDAIHQLASLEELVLCMCSSLNTLPDGLGNIRGMKVLDLRLCPAASHPTAQPLKKKLRENGCTVMVLDVECEDILEPDVAEAPKVERTDPVEFHAGSVSFVEYTPGKQQEMSGVISL